jgi:A/G-specific adenine glycosylase
MKTGRKAAPATEPVPAAAVRLSMKEKGLAPETVALLRKEVYRHYRAHGRRLAWRDTRDPYRILVSEFMLQQTQVERVRGKYHEFLAVFPGFSPLAEASLADVLAVWQGLGYNRRGKALLETARAVVEIHGGALPASAEELLSLPGVGKATAGALTAFAFDRPAVFLETNIRRVYLHFFFPRRKAVKDGEIFPLVEKSLDRRRPRRWYYALMDYGAMLKTSVPNPNRRSAHYQRQSPFEGSDRQVRSRMLRALLRSPGLTAGELSGMAGADAGRGQEIVNRLAGEGFVVRRRGKYVIP